MNAKKVVLIFCAVAAVVAVAGGYLFWGVPGEFSDLKAEDWRNAIFIVGGLIAAIIAAWRAHVADEQAKTDSKKADVAEKSQIADRLARATEQLNSDSIYMRIGAVQALKRVGYDSEDDVMGVLGLLARFVRDRSPAKSKDVGIRSPDAKESMEDAKESMDAIGRLASHYKEFLKGYGAFHLDLSASNLMPFPLLIEGYFRNFNFTKSNIMRGYFSKHDFSGVSFVGVDLTDAFFLKCNLVDAWFTGAILNSASFYDVDMSNATLHWATCNNTDFSTAKNLTTEMLESIIYDAKTPPKVPKSVTLPPPTENKTVPGLLSGTA
ncbi:MAG: pentapeptide repeat-containing protein [Gammaproteobacteria bacterium]|nr:pentapeptide repeat-containing protein [Gammaproteobacteria bacterium]